MRTVGRWWGCGPTPSRIPDIIAAYIDFTRDPRINGRIGGALRETRALGVLLAVFPVPPGSYFTFPPGRRVGGFYPT